MESKWKFILWVLAGIVLAVTTIFNNSYMLFDSGDSEPKVSKDVIYDDSDDTMNELDRLLEDMEFGNLAFNAPTTINIDDSPKIQLILSLAETVETLKQSIEAEGDIIGAVVKVSDRMQAHLVGDMFQVTPIRPEIQAVSKKDRTEWLWKVHPKESGTHELYLTLTALLEIDGHETPRTIRTFDKTITVDVTNSQIIEGFVNEHWKWLWATLVVPVGGWYWKRRKKERVGTSG